MFQNTANQKWRVFAFDKLTNEPVEGHAAFITATLEKDYGAPVALTDVNPVEAASGGGYYYFDVTQAESDAFYLALSPESSDGGVQVLGSPPDQYTHPTTVRNGINPLTVSVIRQGDLAGVANAKVQVEGTELVGFTDSGGEVEFRLTDGDYNLLVFPSILYATPAAVPVSIPAESTKEVELVPVIATTPDLPNQCLCTLQIIGHSGEPITDPVTVTTQRKTDPEFHSGSLLQNELVSVETTTGGVTFPLIQGATYSLTVKYGAYKMEFDFEVPEESTAIITQMV